MAVGAARGFEAGMTVRQAVPQLTRAGLSKSLIRSPAAGGEALGFYEHLEAILGRVQMHLAPKRDVGLHRRTEGIHMAVGVFERQHVVALGQWAEVGVVLEVLPGESAIVHLPRALVREKQILRQSVAFVPGISRVLVWAGTLF